MREVPAARLVGGAHGPAREAHTRKVRPGPWHRAVGVKKYVREDVGREAVEHLEYV